MKKFTLALTVILVIASCAFADPTNDLFRAVKNENSTPQDVRIPIRRGAELNHRNSNGWTPLDLAAMNPNSDVIYTFLKEGDQEIRINMRDEYGNTALMKAAYYNDNPEVVKILIDFGADVNIKNDIGQTALDFARTEEIKQIILDAAGEKKL